VTFPYKQHFPVTPTFTLCAVTRLVMQHLQYARVVQHYFFESLRLQGFVLGHCIMSYLLFAIIKAAVSNCFLGPFISAGQKKHESTNTKFCGRHYWLQFKRKFRLQLYYWWQFLWVSAYLFFLFPRLVTM